MSPFFRLGAIVICQVLWAMPFFLQRLKGKQTAVQVDRRARIGIAIQSMGFMLVYLHGPRFWNSPIEMWRLFSGVAMALVAITLAWRSLGNLGKQWRLEAGLNADHELVTEGAYRIVRHPIYASMFGMLLMGILLAGTLPGWPVAIVFFVIGIEIRIRVEDALLRQRFGSRFTQWQKSVAAWLPFIR